jgi:YidC/Oxa1 family membrane protein insertase
MLIRRFVDEDKIKLKLEENKKKNANKKKSSFQQRLDEAMKAGNASRKKK